MPKLILQELEQRINRLKKVESGLQNNEDERKRIQSRMLELESMKIFVNEQLELRGNKAARNYDFWKLIDEF